MLAFPCHMRVSTLLLLGTVIALAERFRSHRWCWLARPVGPDVGERWPSRLVATTADQLTGAAFIGTVGLDWQFAGIGPVHGAGESDLVLRNKNTGAFEVYDIANNQLTGAASLGSVGLDWQLGGFAADPPTGSMGSSGSTSQLVQAMAGFGSSSGAAENLNTASLSAETSQQQLLTTPQHG